MFFRLTHHSKAQSISGFTLIELLVVTLILAVIAGATVLSFSGVSEQARYDSAKFELSEIRKALLQFRRDSGSNDFPGQGQYDCTDDTNGGSASDLNPNITLPVEISGTDTYKITWCQSPANFWMLFKDPLGHGWNEDTHRGWNGPYLQRTDGYLAIGDDLKPNGEGLPDEGIIIANVWAIASPFMTYPQGPFLLWSNMADPLETGFKEFKQHGSPYYLFDLDDPDQARIVSMSTDGTYSPIDTPNCEQQLDNDEIPIDNVLCLLK